MVEYTRYARERLEPAERLEVEEVDRIAASLKGFLHLSEVQLAQHHVHSAQSGAIQSLIEAHLVQKLGFSSESVVLSGPSVTVRPRADFYSSLGDGRGIIVEVERGGAITNNHDLKDMWKAHLAENAHHLFLVVPQANFRGNGERRERPYAAVVRRFSAFFGDPRRELDVLSTHIYGY